MTRKQFLEIAIPLGYDPHKIVRKKNGTFELRRSYFYTHGTTQEDWGRWVMGKLPAGQFELVETDNSWNAWPKDSYFSAFVKPLA